jgi:hypothetical protein
MPAHHSLRFPRDLDLAMRALQVDSSWYENYWLKEPKPRPAGMVARNLPTIMSCLRLACHRVPLVRRAVVAIALRLKIRSEISYNSRI